MGTAYEAYLRSDEWKQLRERKFAVSGKVCRGCGREHDINVHHIRYRHPFIRGLTKDLIVLCRDCHDTVHAAIILYGIRLRSIREDNVKLVIERFNEGIAVWPTAAADLKRERKQQRLGFRANKRVTPTIPKPTGKEIKNRIQQELVASPWFIAAIRLPRKEFKRLAKSEFKSHPSRIRMLANCFTLYDWRRGQILASTA